MLDSTRGQLIISTTTEVEGRPVREYLGIVSGDAVLRIARTAQRMPGSRRRIRSMRTALEQRIYDTRCQAIATMTQVAEKLDASAIIAVKITYTTIRQPGFDERLVITASGTVVVL